jgi:hypothetical protein
VGQADDLEAVEALGVGGPAERLLEVLGIGAGESDADHGGAG